MTTIFGKIVRGELPADKVYEDETILAFKDINPIAPVHILIIPKKEIPDLQSLAAEDAHLVSSMVQVAQQLAKEFGLDEGYRLITNNGNDAGQEVQHLHFHLVGGRKLGRMG
ncbi:MAG: histidine triad nucleotide-binding protein [Chlamydiota bacterium]|nr:histidine triad nucleotide-binding protein [Chlamydiota bacterium]